MHSKRNIYQCPDTKKPLQVTPKQRKGDQVVTGILSASNRRYPIRDGIPIFVDYSERTKEQNDALEYYDAVSKTYDDVAGLSFRIQYVDETKARKRFVERLELKPNSRVLEIACGTGRDSVNIAARLGAKGEYYLQDLSEPMLRECQKKLAKVSVPAEFLVADGCNLPFPDRYFDAVYSFGGLCVFPDIAGSLREMVRVCKPGARIVAGDESMAPWLYDTEYGRILLSNNPLFKTELPLKYLPREARDVRVQWVVGGVYFLIDFTVGVGDPEADFDLEIPGARGGTLRTRYYGRLEGVTQKTYKLMEEARKKSGKSRHEWLEEVIRKAAKSGKGS